MLICILAGMSAYPASNLPFPWSKQAGCKASNMWLIRETNSRISALQQGDELKTAGVTHIVSVLQFEDYDLQFKDYEDLPKDIKHLVIGVDDSEDVNILQHFPQSNDFIHHGVEAGGGVFVHW